LMTRPHGELTSRHTMKIASVRMMIPTIRRYQVRSFSWKVERQMPPVVGYAQTRR
jgi:hypothetical protein